MASSLPLLLLLFTSSIYSSFGLSSPPNLCPRSDLVFLNDAILSQCPAWIERSSPLQVSGEILDIELSHVQKNTYYAILFYASWCPFLERIQPIFDALSSMFPQIRHLAVEEASALPSVFSRYGVHSFPSIVLVSQNMRIRYHGSKDLSSLALFYEKVTGFKPVAHLYVDNNMASGSTEKSTRLWSGSSRAILKTEPYLTFAILFTCLRVFLYFFPGILSQIKAFLVFYVWHLNLGIFGELRQLVERALHVIDMKRWCIKLNICNRTRNFQKGASNARVWASSFVSVSLSESSSLSRSTSLDT